MSLSSHNEQNYRRRFRIMIISIILVSFTPLLIINGIIAYKFSTLYNDKEIIRLKKSQGKNKKSYKSLVTKSTDNESVHVYYPEDPENNKDIYLLTPLKKEGWVLAYQQPAKKALSNIDQIRRLNMILIAIGVIVVLTVTYLLSRNMMRLFKKSHAENEKMDAQLVETGKLASLGEMSAGLAHEINNPVTIMVEEAGWMEDLLKEEEFADSKNLQEFKRALRQIQNQGSKCKQITHKVLNFAHTVDDQIQLMQINDLIVEAISLSKKKAMSRNIELQTELSPELPQTSISPSEMQQVLLNMINNAMDAMDSQRGGVITIASMHKNSFIHIDVSDTGMGIDSTNLNRIFDPFFTTKPAGKGTGLGLSICYRIIKKMGGDITVDSTVGAGTVFHIQIPITHQKA